MERVDEEGQVATAMSMARIISATPLTMMGPSKIMIFDIHALQVYSVRYCEGTKTILRTP